MGKWLHNQNQNSDFKLPQFTYEQLRNYKEKMGYNGVFIIMTGKCLVICDSSDEKVFAEVGRGTFFGESTVLKSPVSILVITQSRL